METIYISQSKKKAKIENAIVVYEDEASFRQDPTLHSTWAPLHSQPQISSKGQRNSQKIFGAVSLYDGKYIYKHQEKYFNNETYIEFLEENLLKEMYNKGHRIYLIQDNAGYHKHKEVYKWFKNNRKYIEVFQLPPYSPEFNLVERIWQYIRKEVTHNHYFATPEELCSALFGGLDKITKDPECILGYLKPFL